MNAPVPGGGTLTERMGRGGGGGGGEGCPVLLLKNQACQSEEQVFLLFTVFSSRFCSSDFGGFV